MKILDKLKQSNLAGRGGAGFPTHLKWQSTQQALGSPKYVICNASEGEPLINKDFYILKNFPEQVFLGMKVAMDFLESRQAYLNIQRPYYQKLKKILDTLIIEYKKQGYQIEVFEEQPSYIGGEETALLNAIEGKRVEPRHKPPYPSEFGLFGKPTLIHNVETLFYIAAIAQGKFEPLQFISIVDINKTENILQIKEGMTVLEVLQTAKLIPQCEYFVHIFGGASGLVLNSKQIMTQKMHGFGSIIIYSAALEAKDLLLQWFEFYKNESCGKCTPCREGTYQLYQLLQSNNSIPWKEVMAILETLEVTSFCALGRALPVPVKSYYKNILCIG
ncbi:MAG: NADH-ubiquinone oxidoreductase-F iron-sulfur binding region domain-containing protein [Psychromonas sp.]